MQLLNTTKMQAGFTIGMNPDGRQSLVVAVKGTFSLPGPSEGPSFANCQVPLVESDVFSGEPGVSAPMYETDYAASKPRCDVILNGSAYAPGGRAAKRVTVALEVGSVRKAFNVLGNRFWIGAVFGVFASPPEPFVVMPISYDNAFGGIDTAHPNPSKHRSYDANHVGVGFHDQISREFIHGMPLPNTEEIDQPIEDPRSAYRPMAFGVLGRAWSPRVRLAGTYDQNWVDNIFPFLPPDFDSHYYQSASTDQQMAYPIGGEKVTLSNLTPNGYESFQLPRIKMPVVFYLKHEENNETNAVIDTIVIEPDLQRFTITWRASLLLRRNLFEVDQVLIGEVSESWRRARDLGKIYYPSLSALAADTQEPL
jgi:hypothetical protein